MPFHARTGLGLVLAVLLAACSAPKSAGAIDPASAAKAEAEADQFLEKMAKDPAVKRTASGLEYKIVASGPESGPHPGPRDEVKIDYVGQLIDGKVFDSTLARGTPAVMRVEELVPAWQEALPLMRPGDEWILYVPPKLGYGAEGAGGVIPPNAVLIFKIKLLGVLQSGPAKA
jgi:peptidylprolyl isomerase/FKBP-type peptidyl-prolyl cis-trans isomerase FklB